MSPIPRTRSARSAPGLIPSLVFLAFLWTPALRLGCFANAAYAWEQDPRLIQIMQDQPHAMTRLVGIESGISSCQPTKDLGVGSPARDYDICGLFHGAHEVVVDSEKGVQQLREFFGTESSDGFEEGVVTERYTYTVTLDGSGKSKDSACGEGTWLCLSQTITTNEESLVTTLDQPISGTTVSTTDDPLALAGIPLIENEDESFSFDLYLTGGYRGSHPRPQFASIRFICPNSEVSSQLRLVNYNHILGIHSFEWVTPYGCPINTPAGSESSRDAKLVAMDSADERENDEDNEEQNGGDGLQSDNGSKAAARRRIAFALFSLITCALFVLALSSSPILRQRSLRILNQIKLRIISVVPALSSMDLHLPFPNTRSRLRSQYSRIHENRLIRWAQEDMSISTSGLGAYIEGEEDTMVNFSPTSRTHQGFGMPTSSTAGQELDPEFGAYDKWSLDAEDGFGEYIPLTPKKKSSNAVMMWKDTVRNYGSAVVVGVRSPANVNGAGSRGASQ
ncbi:hypothetical protein AX16_005125 [Volvariella volvacea WC 439]|nr:hypothetical protein AX16_005125 [Volvariella volvacea WC 439]